MTEDTPAERGEERRGEARRRGEGLRTIKAAQARDTGGGHFQLFPEAITKVSEMS